MRRPNHASRFEGIAKTNVQASRASDTEILQSQVNKAAKKRLSLNGLEILHGRLPPANAGAPAVPCRLRQCIHARRGLCARCRRLWLAEVRLVVGRGTQNDKY